MGSAISKFGGGTGELQWLQMRVQHLEEEKEKDVEEKTALTARVEELVQQQEQLHKMCEKVYGDCQELRAQHGLPVSAGNDDGPAPKISHLFVEKKKRDLSGDKEPARRPSKKARTTPKAATTSRGKAKVSASAVTPSPASKGRKKKAPDSLSKQDRDEAQAQNSLALLPTKTLDQPSPGFSIEYKETDVLPNWTAYHVTEGVQSILMHFYPGRSRPTPEWKHSGMLREWAPSLVCRHCQGSYNGSPPLQGTQDGCVRLQRQIKKTFNLCVEHLLVCPIASNHSTDTPKELTKELDKVIRKQIDMLFDEEELGSSSEASHDEDDDDDEEESEPSEANRAASSGGLKTTKLIVPELKSLVAESTWFLMEQMMPWYVRKADKRNTTFFTKFKVGSRLLVCRHCLGFRSFSSAKNALRCPSSGVKHILSSCDCCPSAIRAKLTELLKKNHGKEKKKLFLDKLFERVYMMDKDTLIAAQEEAVRKTKSSFAQKMRGDDAEEESDVEVEEEEEEQSAGEAKPDEASEMEVEESSSGASSDAPVSAAGALGDGSIRVFEDEDRDMVSEKTAIIFEQMMPWVVRKKDRDANQYFAMYEVGSRQLVCRHCLAFRRFAAVNTTLKNISHASKHFQEVCPAIPADIRKSLKSAEGRKQPEPERRRFVERVFDRLNSLAKSDIIREQELAESALPVKAPRRKSGTGASRSRARNSKKTDPGDGADGAANGAEEESKVKSDKAAGHSGDHVGVAMSGLHAIGDIHDVHDEHDVHAFEHITKDWDLPAEKDTEMPDSKPEAEKD